jgi:serine/threonine protein kinase
LTFHRSLFNVIGTLLDFRASDEKAMTATFLADMLRGGSAYALAPEIAFAPQVKIELDYSKADIWSLGVILATMMAYHDYYKTQPNGVSVMDSKKQLVVTATPLLLPSTDAEILRWQELIRRIVTANVNDRWSCYDVCRLFTASPRAS